ncbi:DUF222 domain-containing protein [Lentzea sp. NPDC004782]|uniref:DUF222 domain-containing protein n=1 Tax=Lentzea sp. NPDC004782 TaxID=3154458 RepID=UPI0033BEC19D
MIEPDLPLLPTGEVLSALVDEVADIRARHYAVMRKVADLNQRGAASELGYKDLAQVLQHAIRLDRKTAKQWVANAGLLGPGITPTGSEIAPELPVTASAAAEGALSIEHVAVVAEIMKDLPAEIEQTVVGLAREHDPAALRTMGRKLVYALLQNDPEPRDPEPVRQVNQHVMHWKNGYLEIRAKLDTVTGAKYRALMDPLAKPGPTTAEEGPDPRSRAEREGDALAELVDLMLRADQLPEHGGEPVTLTVTMRYEDLAKQAGQGMLDNGERIPAAEVRRLACNAGIIPLILGEKSQPMDIGRKTRSFPAGIRRVLVARDKGCAFPGVRHEALSTNSEVKDRRRCYVAS